MGKGYDKAFMLSLLIAAALLPSLASAQVDRGAVARYDGKGRMVTLFSIYGLDNAGESRCSRLTLTGVIVSVEHDKSGRITNFYVKPRRGKAMNMYLTGITDDGRLPADEVKRLPSLISKGKRVRINFYACGSTGAINEADDITALN